MVHAIKENAINNCPNGYKVFDNNGNAIYIAPVISGTQASEFASLTESQAASKILEMAKLDYLKTGVLASVTAAQMILESGYVKTDLAKKANNCFGMKCSLSGNTWSNSTWDGKSKVNIRTAEEYSKGNITYINADFRKYPCIEDSIGDHSAYLLGAMNGSKLRYSGLKGETDYKKAITIIKNGGYATDSRYINKICNIIERFGLNKYDKDNSDQATSDEALYRVGTSWKNEKCTNQIGAYSILANAKEAADSASVKKKKTYSVFNQNGSKVYTAKYLKSENEFKPYNVRIEIPNLRIRKSPNCEIVCKNGKEVYTGVGIFGIVEEKDGWGKLKSGAGWICLNYTKKV